MRDPAEPHRALARRHRAARRRWTQRLICLVGGGCTAETIFVLAGVQAEAQAILVPIAGLALLVREQITAYRNAELAAAAAAAAEESLSLRGRNA